MKRITPLVILIIIFMLYLVVVPLFPSRQLPQFELYEGKLEFEGTRAYDTLEYLTDNFQNRFLGGVNNIKSATWMKNEFLAMDLEVIEEKFKVFGPKIKNGRLPMDDIMWSSIGDNLKEYVGNNIVAISEGQEEDIILIGAHRDTINTLEGAEDDGSGTATLIELAKIISAQPHRYTYYFVSFDGEELGLYGSEYLAEKYKDRPIKLAISLDMMGWDEANGVSFYPFHNTLGSSELWTYALGINVLDKENIPFVESNWVSSDIVRNISIRTNNMVPTDTDGFIKRGVPGLGVIASRINPKGDHLETSSPHIHSLKDSLDKISPETLEMTGRFTERYIRSIEKIGFDNLPSSKMYLINNQGYVPGYWLWTFFILVIILMLISFKIYFDSCEMKTSIIEIFKRELSWIGLILIGSSLPYLYWRLLSIGLIRSWPLFLHVILWGLFCTLVIIIPGRLRGNKCIRGEEGIMINRTMMFLLTLIWYVIASFYINPFLILSSTIIPLIIMLVLSYKRRAKRIISYIVFFIVSLVFFAKITMNLILSPYLEFSRVINIPYIVVTVPLLIWGVYFASNPIAYTEEVDNLLYPVNKSE